MNEVTRNQSAPEKQAGPESQSRRSESPWINFKELRERLDFAEVLKHYGVGEVKARGGNGQRYGFCPLPDHQSQSKKRSASFSVHLDRKLFHCFGCGKGGNALDFALYMERKDPKNRQHVREVALMLAERFGIRFERREERDWSDKDRQRSPDRESRRTEPTQDDVDCGSADDNGNTKDAGAHEKPGEASSHPVVINAPLDFVLKGLSQEHPYLRERGFTPETIAHFELGYAGRGLMQGRIAIPLRNQKGELIGYAGRLVDERRVNAFPPAIPSTCSRRAGSATTSCTSSARTSSCTTPTRSNSRCEIWWSSWDFPRRGSYTNVDSPTWWGYWKCPARTSRPASSSRASPRRAGSGSCRMRAMPGSGARRNSCSAWRRTGSRSG